MSREDKIKLACYVALGLVVLAMVGSCAVSCAKRATTYDMSTGTVGPAVPGTVVVERDSGHGFWSGYFMGSLFAPSHHTVVEHHYTPRYTPIPSPRTYSWSKSVTPAAPNKANRSSSFSSPSRSFSSPSRTVTRSYSVGRRR